MQQELIYFNWFEIQKQICTTMGIDKKYFRDYHLLIGGEYKDLWHEWMRYFNNDVVNDQIVRVEMNESLESKLEWAKQDGKD